MRLLPHFNQSASMNIFELDAASNNSVDDVRELVSQVNILRRRDATRCTSSTRCTCSPRRLSTLSSRRWEEPPAYAKFILATTEKHKIIPTILSRCQVFDFKRIKTEDIGAIWISWPERKRAIRAAGAPRHRAESRRRPARRSLHL